MKYVINYAVEHYQKGSIFKCEELNNINFYFPLRNTHVNYGYYGNRSNDILVNNTLSLLGEEKDSNGVYHSYYLVLENIVIFTTMGHFTLNNNSNQDDFEDLENDYLNLLFDDIKDMDEMVNFNHLGIALFSVNCLIEEHWTQGYDDWDCYTDYVGVLKDNIDSRSLVIDKSLQRLKDFEEAEKHRYDDMSDLMELSSIKFT